MYISQKKFSIPEQCKDKPYQKQKKDNYIKENEIIDLFSGLEQQAKQQKQQKQYQEQMQRNEELYAENQDFGFNSTQQSAFEKFNSTMDRIQQRKIIRQEKQLQEQEKQIQQRDQQDQLQGTSKSNTLKNKEKDYTLFDGKIHMILEPEQAEIAQQILGSIQGYLQEKHEDTVKQLEQKKQRMQNMQMTYMKDEEFQKRRVQLRMDPYEAKLVKEYLQEINQKTNFKQEMEEYAQTKMPWKKQHNSNVEKPKKTGEQERLERIQELKKFKKEKRKEAEKQKAEPKLHKKDFDLAEFTSPNQEIVQKFCNQEFAEKTNFYEQKKRNLPAEESDKFQDELEFLLTYFELMNPQDYLLKCDFYKKGVKINRDRQIKKEDMVYAIKSDTDFRSLYNIQDDADIEDRLTRTKTIHILYINFKEFVEFLYINGKVKRLDQQEYRERTNQLKSLINKEKEAQQKLQQLEEEDGEEDEGSGDIYQDEFNEGDYDENGQLNIKKKSKKSLKLKNTNDDDITEYPIKITVPEPFKGAEYFAQLYKENKQKRLDDSEIRQDKELEKMKKTQSFKPKPIPAAVQDRGLWEKMIEEQEERRKQIKMDSIANTLANEKPFSFYHNDKNPIQRRKVERKEEYEILIKQMMSQKFKANKKIAWTSQVNMFEQMKEKEEQWHNERKAARAIIMKRMSQNFQKQYQQQQKQLQDISNKYSFKPQKRKPLPDFERKQQEFQEQLDQQKQARPPTQPQPFNFEETHKAPIRDYMDQENTLMKHTKEKPQVDKIQEARKVTNSIPQYMPVSTKKTDQLIEFRWKEREEKLKKEIQKEMALQKKKKKHDQFAHNVWDTLKDDTYQRQQEEIQRKKQFQKDLDEKLESFKEMKQNALDSAAEQPLLFTRENVTGLKYPYNKIFQNYENIFRDTNCMKKMKKLEGWENQLDSINLQNKVQQFVDKLKKKNDSIKNFQQLAFPWNHLLKDGENNVIKDVIQDLAEKKNFQWKPTNDKGYLEKHDAPPPPKRDFSFKVNKTNNTQGESIYQ